MSQSPVNIHRSFAGLLVGNLVALFVSGLACILIWQSVFPDFYAQLRQHIKDVKQASNGNDNSNQNERGANEKAAKQDIEKAEQPAITPMPEFGLAVWATTWFIDAVFATLAGYLCVRIAGFARNNHGVLMALFIVVWKIQQLVGFVDNQLPPSLILAEVTGLPIACLIGATLCTADDQDPSDDGPAGDNLAEDLDEEYRPA